MNAAQKAILEESKRARSEGVSQFTPAQQAILDEARGGRTNSTTSKDDGSDFVAGVAGGIDSMQGTAYGLVGLAGAGLERTIGVGEGLRDWGFKGYQDNMAEVDSEFRDSYTWDGATSSVSNFVDAGAYYLGRAVPDAAAALLSGGIGSTIAKKAISEGVEAVVKDKAKDLVGDALGDRVTSAAIGSTTGILAQGVGQATGGIYGQAGERAIAEGGSLEDVNLGRVVGYGALSGTLESVADIATLGLARFGPAKNLMEGLAKGGKARQAATRGTTGAGVEALTEGVQSGLEDMGAGATAGEANFMDPTSMMAGAFGGAGMGSVGGALSPANRQGTQIDTETATQLAEEEAALVAQEEAEATQVGLAQQAEITEQARLRRDAAQTFVPRAEFIKARKAEASAAAAQDIRNTETELGQAFEQHVNEKNIFDPTEVAAEAVKFQKGYEKSADTTQLDQDYLTALDAHVEIVGRAKQVVAANPDVMTLDDESLASLAAQDPEAFGVIGTMRAAANPAPVAETAPAVTAPVVAAKPKPLTKKAQLIAKAEAALGPTWEIDNPELSSLISDGKGTSSRGKGKKSRFETMLDKTVADKAELEGPKGLTGQAEAFANEQLGANWRNERPELAAVLYNGTLFEFQAGVEAAVAETSTAPAVDDNVPVLTDVVDDNVPVLTDVVETEQAATPTQPAPVVEPEPTAVDPAVPGLPLATDLGLSRNEEKVYDVILKAFRDNDQASVSSTAPDGRTTTWESKKIAALTGIKENHASTNIKRIKEKIAKFYGSVDTKGVGDPTAIKQQLADTRIQNAIEYDGTEDDSEGDGDDATLDMNSLAPDGEMSTSKTSAYEGVDDETKAWTQKQETAPTAQTAAQRAAIRAEFDAAMKKDRKYKVAVDLWNNGFESDVENEADRVPFESMDAGSRLEWFAFTTDYNSGDLDLDALGQEYDFIRADFIKDTQNAKRQSPDPVGQIAGQADPEETAPVSGGVREEGARPEQSEERADGEENPTQLTAEQFKERSASVAVTTKKKRRVVKPTVAAPVVDTKPTPTVEAKTPAGDTRGQGTQYHGSSREVTSLDDSSYGPVNIYGQGFYTTDAADIATGYSNAGRGKGPKSPVVYKVTKLKDANLFDLEQPLTPQVLGWFSQSRVFKADEAQDLPATSTVRDALDYLRSTMTDDMETADAIQDSMESFRRTLENAGFEGYRHVGGTFTGKAPHNVEIFWEPSEQLKIERTTPAEVEPTPTVEAKAPKKREGSVAQVNSADAIAERLGGEVVYQNGELSLVRGYSNISGAPVYAAAKNDTYTKVDVESYTGNVFTPSQKAELVAAKTAVETEAQRVHAETPFVTYENGLAFSENTSPELQGIARGWKELLGLESEVYITTLSDAKANKLNFTGPLRAVGSGTLDSNERGSTRRMADGTHYIIFDDQPDKAATLETLAHEMGHIHQKEAFDSAPASLKGELYDAHKAWLAEQKGGTAKALVEALRARKTGKTTKVGEDLMAHQAQPYWKSFSEWYADQVSRWATTQKVPLTVVEKFFSRLGKAMKSFYAKVANKKYLPSSEFVNYLSQVKGAALRDPLNDNVDLQSDAMKGSMEPTPEGRANTGRYAQKAGEVFGPKAEQFVNDSTELFSKAARSLEFVHQFIRRIKGRLPEAGVWYQAVKESDKTRQDIRRQVEAIAIDARNLTGERLVVVNDFVSKSTYFQKWGYNPQFTDKNGDPRVIKTDAIMERAYNRLAPVEQKLVRDMFQHGENMRLRKLAIAKEMGIPKTFFSAEALDGPYAPLKRFGKYATVLKSQALLDAEALDTAESSPATRKTVEELKSDGDNYVVSFFDTMGLAKKFRNENAKTYAYASASQRANDVMEDRTPNAEVFQKVLGALSAADKSQIDPASKAAFSDLVRDMYFDSLDQRDARMSGAKRKNRAGYEKNMIRSFLSHASAESAMISTMEHGAEVNMALAATLKAARKNETELMPMYNMMAAHYKDSLVYKQSTFQSIQNRIAAGNSVWMLTSSIGYHVTNATQPAAVTVPFLAGHFNSYSGAWKSLLDGYTVANGAIRMTKDLETEIDVEKTPEKYRALLKELQLRGLLDVGMEEDLASFERFNTGYEGLNAAGDVAGKITHKLYQTARFVEAQNRISSAVAAYDMALAKPSVPARFDMTPVEYATAIVEDTQGNFGALDAPLLLKKLPKLTVQYRKYQFLMAANYVKSFQMAFTGESPEVRAAGKRTLGYMLTHAGIMGGLTGIPLVSSISATYFWLANLVSPEEDEPQDLERFIRENVPGKFGEVLARGGFSAIGIDMSTKLSQDNIFKPFPYTEIEPTEDALKDIVFNLAAGPSGTTMLNFLRSAEYAANGDVSKAIEHFVPKGLRKPLESYRLATEGMSFKNGDIVVTPEEMRASGMVPLLVNALGIPVSLVENIKYTRSQQYEISQHFSTETGRIRREYIDAHQSGDPRAKLRLKREWRTLQGHKDRLRGSFGNDSKALRRQSISDLIKAPFAQRRRERGAASRFE